MSTPTNAGKTIVTTAEGDVVAFGDFVSRFIVSHPKTAAVISLVLGGVIGWIIR